MSSIAGTTVLILMGVSGSGKTTIGRALSSRFGWAFLDADDLHPPDNVAKMRRGVGLDDGDRAPWLAAVRARIEEWRTEGERAAVACSALKRAYRNVLRVDDGVGFVYLRTPIETLASRLARRERHYAGPSLLDSQLRDLEEPSPDEALVVDASLSVDAVVARVEAALALRSGR